MILQEDIDFRTRTNQYGETEEWAEIENYPNYIISDCGHVMNDRTGLVLKNHYDKDGYLLVGIRNSAGPSTKKVHRLVAASFIGRIRPGLEVNHIDGDKAYNHVLNLEIISHSDNLHHAYREGLHSASRPIRCVETGIEVASISEASREMGM